MRAMKNTRLWLIVGAILIVSVLGGCAPKNPLVGKWNYHDTSSIYSADCPIGIEFTNDGTVRVGSAVGTYKDMGIDKIMINFSSIDSWTGFQPGIVYDYAIRNGILSIKGIQFYCEFSNSLGPAEGSVQNVPTPTPARSPEQNNLLASVGGKGKIVFDSTRDGLWNLYIMNPDGSDMRPLTKEGVIGMSPDCSPDGKRIVARDIAYTIFVINLDGTGRVDLVTSGENVSPRWSLDGKQIVYVSGELSKGEIYLMNADGSAQTQITFTGKDNLRPIWTPDGKIVFYAQVEKKYYLMNSDGSDVSEITEETYADYEREWAPDKTAYVSEMPGPFDITLFSADGSLSVRLMEDEDGDFSPTWCP